MDEPQPDFPANDQSQSSIDAEEKLIENEKKEWEHIRGFTWWKPGGSTSTCNELIAAFEWPVTESNSVSIFTSF